MVSFCVDIQSFKPCHAPHTCRCPISKSDHIKSTHNSPYVNICEAVIVSRSSMDDHSFQWSNHITGNCDVVLANNLSLHVEQGSLLSQQPSWLVAPDTNMHNFISTVGCKCGGHGQVLSKWWLTWLCDPIMGTSNSTYGFNYRIGSGITSSNIHIAFENH